MALYWADAVNNVEVAKLLLRFVTNLDLQNNNDEIPLFLAVKNGRFEMAKLLLENLANINIPNDMNQLPQNISADGNIVELLENFKTQLLLSVSNGQAWDVVILPYIQSMVKKSRKNLAAKSPDAIIPDKDSRKAVFWRENLQTAGSVQIKFELLHKMNKLLGTAKYASLKMPTNQQMEKKLLFAYLGRSEKRGTTKKTGKT